MRESDGYLNATQLCKLGTKNFNDSERLNTTSKLLKTFATLDSVGGINMLRYYQSLAFLPAYRGRCS